MSKKDLARIAIVKITKLRNTVGKKITTFVDRENRLIPKKIKETIHSLRNPNILTKFTTCFLKYGFLIYVRS